MGVELLVLPVQEEVHERRLGVELGEEKLHRVLLLHRGVRPEEREDVREMVCDFSDPLLLRVSPVVESHGLRQPRRLVAAGQELRARRPPCRFATQDVGLEEGSGGLVGVFLLAEEELAGLRVDCLVIPGQVAGSEDVGVEAVHVQVRVDVGRQVLRLPGGVFRHEPPLVEQHVVRGGRHAPPAADRPPRCLLPRGREALRRVVLLFRTGPGAGGFLSWLFRDLAEEEARGRRACLSSPVCRLGQVCL